MGRDDCKAECQRRCCVLRPGDKEREKRVQGAPFMAPVAHPLWHPSLHATQLRAISFATRRRVTS
eukprot:7505764-Pyramimonas_sp.AAC.1